MRYCAALRPVTGKRAKRRQSIRETWSRAPEAADVTAPVSNPNSRSITICARDACGSMIRARCQHPIDDRRIDVPVSRAARSARIHGVASRRCDVEILQGQQ